MAKESRGHARGPTPAQRKYLRSGLDQPGGKLPLFDQYGQEVSRRTVMTCIEQGWAEPWFSNPTKPDWMVCKLTAEGRRLAESGQRRSRSRIPAKAASA
jgi:hypothetical protein